MAHSGDLPKTGEQWQRYVEQQLAELDSRLRGTGAIRQAKNVVTTTDSNGRASFLFGRTYAAAPVVQLTGGNGELVAIHAATITTTGFTVQFRYPATGDPMASVLVRLLWTATPVTV